MATAGKTIGVGGAVLGGLAAGVLAIAKGIAMNDRRRSGTTKQQALSAVGWADPSDAQHRQLTMRDGSSIHVVERTGSKNEATIVLLHGVTLSARVWHQALDDLGNDFRTIALDWRGHGRSVAGADGYGLGLLAGDLAEVLQQLDVHDCVIVGHSMGGMALMQFCGLHPSVLQQRVKALMFLSTASNDVGVASVPAFVRSTVRRIAGIEALAKRASWTAPGDVGYSMVRVTFGEKPDPKWVEQTRDIVADMDPAATAASVVPLLGHDATATLKQLTLPVMVVVGTDDRMTPPKQSRRTADLIPGAKLVVMDGPGHMLMLERQAEFHQLVRELARSSS
jgi:non-heme chloroperoxidase